MELIDIIKRYIVLRLLDRYDNEFENRGLQWIQYI